jgi:hypothetical protein
MAGSRWMSKESEREKHAGTKGSFSAAAARAGKSTSEFAKEHEHSSGTIGKRARMAEAFAKARRKK